MTRIAAESERLSAALTQTAQASITPSTTPTTAPTLTATPVPPTPTPDRPLLDFDTNNLPAAMFSMTDPAGDTIICATGEAVDDPAVDIRGVMVFDLQSLGRERRGGLRELKWESRRAQPSQLIGAQR